MTMATRQAFRYVSRRLSSGKIFSEEEKAAENIYIKKMEQEKLAKAAQQGQKSEGASASAGSSGAASESSASSASSTGGVSTDKYRNYAVVAGVLTGLGALGWYLKSKDTKTDEIRD